MRNVAHCDKPQWMMALNDGVMQGLKQKLVIKQAL